MKQVTAAPSLSDGFGIHCLSTLVHSHMVFDRGLRYHRIRKGNETIRAEQTKTTTPHASPYCLVGTIILSSSTSYNKIQTRNRSAVLITEQRESASTKVGFENVLLSG